MKNIFRNDAFKKARGGYSRLLEISCASCDTLICTYQKDGPGILKRMYIDRIVSSPMYSNIQKTLIKDLPQCVCPHCGEVLGVPMIYKKEDRPAYRLFVGCVKKKIVKA